MCKLCVNFALPVFLCRCNVRLSRRSQVVNMRYQVHEMQSDDVKQILQIQARLYSAGLLENADLFLNRLALSPGTSFVAHVESELLGYLLAYPWAQSTPPELNVVLSTLPQDANSWFLHDVPSLPELRA
jgi:hypothetical protein